MIVKLKYLETITTRTNDRLSLVLLRTHYTCISTPLWKEVAKFVVPLALGFAYREYSGVEDRNVGQSYLCELLDNIDRNAPFKLCIIPVLL
jgi:hypothetical protein